MQRMEILSERVRSCRNQSVRNPATLDDEIRIGPFDIRAWTLFRL